MANSGYGPDGIYRSPRPRIPFPTDPNTSMLDFLFRNAGSYPDRVALVDADSGESLTFRELRSSVASFAAGLRSIGIKKGDIVLVFAPNSIRFPVCFLSVVSLGAIATTANPSYTTAELTKQVKDSGPKLIITVPRLRDKVSSLGIPIIDIGSRTVNVPSAEFSPPNIQQSDVAGLLYSSGTSGASKGVVLTHRNFICAAKMAAADQDLKGDPPNTALCFLPMFHAFGLSVVTYAQLQRGNTVVVLERFEMESVLRAVETYRVTHLFVVPPVMLALAKRGKASEYDLSSLRWVRSGAAPLGAEVLEEVSRILPGADVLQGYGLTEAAGNLSLGFGNGDRHQFSSTGFLVSGVECKVVSTDTSKSLPPNHQGELWFRGPNIMKGYFNNLEATKMTIDEQGWLRTGDLGYIDDNGYVFVVDRIKELIKCKGFQVAPAELEGLLTSHPDILDAAVIRFPDAEAGEVPIAFIVRSRDSMLTSDDVEKFVTNQVAPYKRLRRVTFVNNIPKSAAGKILRRELIAKVATKL